MKDFDLMRIEEHCPEFYEELIRLIAKYDLVGTQCMDYALKRALLIWEGSVTDKEET